jgi:hypothetical protein
MLKQSVLVFAFAALALLQPYHPADAAVISVGAFPEPNPAPPFAIPAGTFLVPVEISGANNLQLWQFDLLFDNVVVEVVDSLDGSSGMYGAEFTPGDPSTLSFILGGLPLNFLGLVDDVAGFYPSLTDDLSGEGVLAYVLFQFLPGQEGSDPSIRVTDASIFEPVPIPEPGTLALLVAALLLLSWRLAVPTGKRFLRFGGYRPASCPALLRRYSVSFTGPRREEMKHGTSTLTRIRIFSIPR